MAAMDVVTAAAVQLWVMADRGRDEGVLTATVTVPVDVADGEVTPKYQSRVPRERWEQPVDANVTSFHLGRRPHLGRPLPFRSVRGVFPA